MYHASLNLQLRQAYEMEEDKEVNVHNIRLFCNMQL